MDECKICYDEITDNTVVYNWINNNRSKSNFCSECVNYMINNNFNNYINDINKTDCEKSLKSALSTPIPLNLTIDSLKKSQQIDFIEYSDKKISAKLEKKISDEDLNLLNIELKEILLKMNNLEFDYINEIIKIINKFNLKK